MRTYTWVAVLGTNKPTGLAVQSMIFESKGISLSRDDFQKVQVDALKAAQAEDSSVTSVVVLNFISLPLQHSAEPLMAVDA